MQAEATPAQCSSVVVVVTTALFVLLPCQSPGSPRVCLCAVLWEVFVHLLPGFFCPWLSLALCACFFPRLCVIVRALQRDSPSPEWQPGSPAEGQAALPACNAAASPLQSSAQSSWAGLLLQHCWARQVSWLLLPHSLLSLSPSLSHHSLS